MIPCSLTGTHPIDLLLRIRQTNKTPTMWTILREALFRKDTASRQPLGRQVAELDRGALLRTDTLHQAAQGCITPGVISLVVSPLA